MNIRVFFASLALGSLNAGSAKAAFPQYVCPSGSWLAVPSKIGAMEYDTRALTPPGAPNDRTLYAFNTTAGYLLYTNGTVTQVRPRFGFFRTEPGYDILSIETNTGVFNYSGDINTSTVSLFTHSDIWTPIAAGGIKLLLAKWTSDHDIAEYAPPRILGVDVKCAVNGSSVATNGTTIATNKRYDGLLLRSGDTIYFSAIQPAGKRMSVLLNQLNSPGADFDLYVSTSNPTPDDSSYTWRGYTASASEAIPVPASGSNRVIYIGVHSLAGSGHFSLHALAHHTDVAQSFCTIGFTPNATEQNQIRTHLQGAAARMTTVTNGNIAMLNFVSFGQKATCDSTCDICLDNGEGPGLIAYPPGSAPGCGQAFIPRSSWSLAGGVGDAGYAAHELVHSCLNIDDEYYRPPSFPLQESYCTHTIVSNYDGNVGLCTLGHCDQDDDNIQFATMLKPDYSSQWTRSCTHGTGWEQLHARYGALYGPAYWTNTETADPTLYGSIPAFTSSVPVYF